MTYSELEQFSSDIYNELHATLTWEDLPESARESIKKRMRQVLEGYEIERKSRRGSE